MEYFAKDQLYRISGDEFVIICPKVQEAVFIRQAQLLKERLKQEEQGLAAFGYLWNDGTTAADSLLHGAERLMYQEKQQHYQENYADIVGQLMQLISLNVELFHYP